MFRHDVFRTESQLTAVVSISALGGILFALSNRASAQHVKTLHSTTLFFLGLLVLNLYKPEFLAWLFNPWEMETKYWFALYVGKVCGLILLDLLVLGMVKCSSVRPLEYCENNPRAKGLERLEWIDYSFLLLNSVIETVFVHHLCRFVSSSPNIVFEMDKMSVLNTVVVFVLFFVIDDLFYAPSHYLMHLKWLYPYIHKHHHRQNLPVRGYFDAGNEHPLEQLAGLGCLFATLHLVGDLCQIHIVSLGIYFIMYAAMAVLNHTRFDFQSNILGFHYAVGAHEMHHRYPKTNFAQYFMVWDKLVGTYKPYHRGVRVR
jgi:sterol desaturase/sphingolipid hydroxylase (fatty acid hydroxylase superfamily)